MPIINSLNTTTKIFYRPIDAAIRWCGLMTHEQEILASFGDDYASLPTSLPQWPCLHSAVEKIFDAIRNHELPYGFLGKTVPPGTSMDLRLLTLRHTDLKFWILHHYPDQRPTFLFGVESENIERFSVGTYLILRADRDALEVQLKAAENVIRELLEDLNNVGLERENLRALAKTQGRLSERSEVVYQNVVGALVETLLGSTPAGKPNSVFISQAAIVDSITAHFQGVSGLSKRSLDEKFAIGRRSLAQAKR